MAVRHDVVPAAHLRRQLRVRREMQVLPLVLDSHEVRHSTLRSVVSGPVHHAMISGMCLPLPVAARVAMAAAQR